MNIAFIIALLAIGAAVYFFVIRKKDSAPAAPQPQPFTPAQTSPAWGIYYSPGMPAALDASGGFTFPPAGSGGVDYILRKAIEAGRTSITMSFRIEGDGQLLPVQGTTPTVSLIIERVGDTLTADKPSYRFYGGSTPLVPGDHAITVLLMPDKWTNVFGQQDPEGFAACLAALDNVGFVFGDPAEGATGHGVFAKGNVRFTLLNYTVT